MRQGGAELRLARRNEAAACGFTGNPDIYGLGIRLGIYFQWIAAIISKCFDASPEAIRELMEVDAIFLLAILIATLLLSASSTYAVEVLIMLHFFFGDVYTVYYDSSMVFGGTSTISVWSITFRSLMHTTMAAYAVWFWFPGLEL
jgi:hypothetical protein